MSDYSKAKIYKIEPICDHEEDEIYIGSTTKSTLAQRMTTHRSNYKQWKKGKYNHTTSFNLFEKYDIENCRIYLIESYPCETRDELRAREGHFIKTLKCVNKCVAGRTDEESKKIYYEENKKSILENQKINYEKNKETILAKKLEKHTCICGCEYTYVHYQRHCKSKKHVDFILNNPQEA